jgi:arsenate reductase
MAEGLLRAKHGDRYAVFSAGTEKTHVRPLAIDVMQEKGIDISHHASKTIDMVADEQAFDVVVTVCDHAREVCPYVPARKWNLHHSFDDPSAATGAEAEQRAVFRRVRDEIDDWVDATFGPEDALAKVRKQDR